MTNYNDGMIHGWNGGDCPVHLKSEVRYWLSNGNTYTANAGGRCWKHNEGGIDIIAFRVTKAYVEPKTIWAVYYTPTGCMLDCFPDQATALKCAGHIPEERKVIEFKEVTE